jgi:hypothetical protein
VNTCLCEKNGPAHSCDHERQKVNYTPKPVGEHEITQCDDEDCFCHHWPKMNRHERRKFQKTGDRE